MEEYYYDNILDWHFHEIPSIEFQHKVWDALDSTGEIEAPEIDPEDIGESCEKLYIYSLRIKRRLPQELHEKMLLWSYSDEGEMCVRLYLSWVERCEELEERRKRHEKFEKTQEAAMLLMMGACAVTIFFFTVL